RRSSGTSAGWPPNKPTPKREGRPPHGSGLRTPRPHHRERKSDDQSTEAPTETRQVPEAEQAPLPQPRGCPEGDGLGLVPAHQLVRAGGDVPVPVRVLASSAQHPLRAPPVTSSREVSWWTVHEFVTGLLAAVGDWPMVGTPQWRDLPDGDPRKLASLLDAARH